MWKFENISFVVSTSFHDPLQRSIALIEKMFSIKDQSSDESQRFRESLNDENHYIKYERKNVTHEVIWKTYFYDLRSKIVYYAIKIVD